MTAKDRLFCALDTPDIASALSLAEKLKDAVGGIKIGKEFFTANGPQGVAAVQLSRLPLFLDLKFHDIPNTVAGAVKSCGKLQPALLTIHAGGGPAMIKAARQASQEMAEAFGCARPRILAVTVLTSLDENDLGRLGIGGRLADQVKRLAALAQEAGADGAVCSPHEITLLRELCGPGFTLVVPGIRPAGSDKGDQKRVTTPREAIEKGADILVVGRPITQAADPAAAAHAILADIKQAGG